MLISPTIKLLFLSTKPIMNDTTKHLKHPMLISTSINLLLLSIKQLTPQTFNTPITINQAPIPLNKINDTSKHLKHPMLISASIKHLFLSIKPMTPQTSNAHININQASIPLHKTNDTSKIQYSYQNHSSIYSSQQNQRHLKHSMLISTSIINSSQ